MSKATPSDDLGFASKRDSLGVSEAHGFAVELFEEDAVLFLEVFYDDLLVPIDPAGDSDEEEVKVSRHAGRNYPENGG